jgi:site-specific recombinase XerD
VSSSSLVFGQDSARDEDGRPSEGASSAASKYAAAAAAPAASTARPSAAALATLESPSERTEHYASRSKSQATINAYAAGWQDFLEFCRLRALTALPATDQTVAAYLAFLADNGFKAATVARRLVVISQAHKAANLPSPTTSSLVSRTHAGIRRSIGTAQQGKAPAVVADLKRMLGKVPNTRVGLRDRALLLLGFAGGFRRSELVALDVEDLEFSGAGLVVVMRKSKTDQEGRSRRIGVPYGSSDKTCPVRSLQAWLETARISEGAVFRSLDRFQRVQPRRLSDKAVARVVKRRAKAVGLDPDRYAGHSLRAGLATSAAAGGASERAIMNQTGHRSTDMVRRYIREANLFAPDNAASLAGL